MCGDVRGGFRPKFLLFLLFLLLRCPSCCGSPLLWLQLRFWLWLRFRLLLPLLLPPLALLCVPHVSLLKTPPLFLSRCTLVLLRAFVLAPLLIDVLKLSEIILQC